MKAIFYNFGDFSELKSSEMLLNVTWNRFNSLRPSDAYICVGNLTIVGSDNGLSPGRRQAIIWTNDGILLMRPLGTNFSEISSEILIFSFKKMRLKMSSAKWRQFSLALNVLNDVSGHRLAIHKTLHDTWYAPLLQTQGLDLCLIVDAC